MIGRTLRIALCPALALLIPGQVLANEFDQGPVSEAICADARLDRNPRASDLQAEKGVWRSVSQERVAFFILAFAGRMASPGDAIITLRSQFEDTLAADARLYEVVDAFRGHATVDGIESIRIYERTATSADDFYDSTKARRVFDPIGGTTGNAEEGGGQFGYDWYLEDRFTVRCFVEISQGSIVASRGGAATGTATPARPPFDLADRLRLRGSVKDLSASGADLKKASAASIGLARSRKFQSDGSRVETDTLAVNAFLGLDLSPGGNGAYPKTLLFAGYERNSARSDPAPALTPPATERDSDTEVLQFGLQHSTILPLGRAEPGQGDPSGPRRSFSTSAALTVDGAYLFDMVKDSERFRMDASMDFYHRDGLGPLCGIGVFDEVAEKFWTRCSFSARADWNFITREGRLTNIAKTEFGHIGGRLGFDAIVGAAPSGGPFIALEYLNLQRIAGDATFIPDIERHEFAVGYRWWTSGKVGIEAKTSLADGINPDSLVDENELSISFGLIF